MTRWLAFLLKLPFMLIYFVLYGVYFLLWYLLRVIGSYAVLALGLIGVVIAAFQPDGLATSGQMLAAAAACALVNRGCYYLTRLMPPPGRRPNIRMPLAPKRTAMAAPSPVKIALPRCPGSASPSEAVMRSRLDPALQAIMQG
jgi:hypothetical protein